MEDTKIETTDSINGAEGTEETNEEVVADTTTEETGEPEYSENEKKLYARAKQAEAELKTLKAQPKPQVKSSEQAELSTKDVLFLAKADVHEDDIDEVLEWSKFKKISVSEAHKQLKGVLAGKAEERKTAEATNTGTARRGASKVSDESILENAKSGNLPDSDTDLDRLVRTRLEKQRSKA